MQFTRIIAQSALLTAVAGAALAAPPTGVAPPTPVVLETALDEHSVSGQPVRFRDAHHCEYTGMLTRDQGLAGNSVLWDRWGVTVDQRTCAVPNGAARAEDVRLAVGLEGSPTDHPLAPGARLTLAGYRSRGGFGSPGAEAWTKALVGALEAASQPSR